MTIVYVEVPCPHCGAPKQLGTVSGLAISPVVCYECLALLEVNLDDEWGLEIIELREGEDINDFKPMNRKHALVFALQLLQKERLEHAPMRNAWLKGEYGDAGIDKAMAEHHYNRYNRCNAAIMALEKMVDEEETNNE